MYGKIVARITNGVKDTGCKVVWDNGSVNNITFDNLVEYIQKGVIVNAILDRGCIVIDNYSNLPTLQLGGNVSAPIILYKIVDKRNKIIGYEILAPNLKILKYSKEDVVQLIGRGIVFANNITSVINGDILFNEHMFSINKEGEGIHYVKPEINTRVENSGIISEKKQYEGNFDMENGVLKNVRQGAVINNRLIIPDGVKKIEFGALDNIKFKKVEIPDSIVSIKYADKIFNYYSLVEVYAPRRFVDMFFEPSLDYFIEEEIVIKVGDLYYLKSTYNNARKRIREMCKSDRYRQYIINKCKEADVDFRINRGIIEIENEDEVIALYLYEEYDIASANAIYYDQKSYNIFKFIVKK